MLRFLYLVENEAIKLGKRRRFLLVNIILIILVAMFAYGQKVNNERLYERAGTTNWRPVVQEQIVQLTNRVQSVNLSEARKRSSQIRIEQLQYDLQHNINPMEPGSATFVRIFMDLSIALLMPLLVVTMSADLVSAEWAEGTIKLLLTRPVPRWKILLSKFVTLLMFVSMMVVATGLIGTVIGGFFFGWGGWNTPVATGFQIINGQLDMTNVINVPQWEYILESYGLGWVVALVVGLITCMVSILVRSTAAAMGILLAAVIAGNILAQVASSWTAVKYLFDVNLGLTSYLSGQMPPIEGMTLPFSLTVLAIWGLLACIVSFAVFTRRDVLA